MLGWNTVKSPAVFRERMRGKGMRYVPGLHCQSGSVSNVTLALAGPRLSSLDIMALQRVQVLHSCLGKVIGGTGSLTCVCILGYCEVST